MSTLATSDVERLLRHLGLKAIQVECRGIREIARALSCSRDTVREVRDGTRQSPDAPKSSTDPLWMLQLDWPAIVHDLGLGHPLKFIWEEKAQHLTTYSNFWKWYGRPRSIGAIVVVFCISFCTSGRPR